MKKVNVLANNFCPIALLPPRVQQLPLLLQQREPSVLAGSLLQGGEEKGSLGYLKSLMQDCVLCPSFQVMSLNYVQSFPQLWHERLLQISPYPQQKRQDIGTLKLF